MRWFITPLVLSLLAACHVQAPVETAVDVTEPSPEPVDRGDEVVAPDVPEPAAVPPAASRPPGAVLPPATRLVAIGDVHGDIAALRGALKVAQVIDEEDRWVGGATTVVQVGDQLDRGDDEREILHWLEDLAIAAKAAGGAVYPMLGNHETMNVALDLRYVTAGGFVDFADVAFDATDTFYGPYAPEEKGRVAAFRPGGPYAKLLAEHVVALVVGDTAFAHGGLLPEHAAYGLATINSETRAWMLGQGPRPTVLSGDTSPVWSRHYSNGPDAADCALLEETLEALNAARMVVAHTVHKEGITSACQGKVWRVDVGLAAYYGGPTQVLVIEGETVTVLP